MRIFCSCQLSLSLSLCSCSIAIRGVLAQHVVLYAGKGNMTSTLDRNITSTLERLWYHHRNAIVSLIPRQSNQFPGVNVGRA